MDRTVALDVATMIRAQGANIMLSCQLTRDDNILSELKKYEAEAVAPFFLEGKLASATSFRDAAGLSETLRIPPRIPCDQVQAIIAFDKTPVVGTLDATAESRA